MIDWVIKAFSPHQFPWFRDEFIHPDELASAYSGEPLVNMFAGFGGGMPEQTSDHPVAPAARPSIVRARARLSRSSTNDTRSGTFPVSTLSDCI